MLGYVVHLFWAAWEVVWYLVRIFIFREPVSASLGSDYLIIGTSANDLWINRFPILVDRDPILKVARENGLTRNTELTEVSGSSVLTRSPTEFLSVSLLSFLSLVSLLAVKFGTRTTVMSLPVILRTKSTLFTVPIVTPTRVIFC